MSFPTYRTRSPIFRILLLEIVVTMVTGELEALLGKALILLPLVVTILPPRSL